MAHLTFFGKIKSTILLFGIGLIALIGCALLLQNRNGFSGRWSGYIETALERNGIHCTVSSYRYSVTRGFIAEGIVIYAPEDSTKQLASFEQLTLKVDRASLSKGKFVPQKCILKNGVAWVDLKNEENTRFPITNLRTEIDLSDGKNLKIVSATGLGKGIPFEVQGHCIDLLVMDDSTKGEPSHFTFPEPLRMILGYLDQLSFAKTTPPRADIQFTLDLQNEPGLTVDIAFQSDELAHAKFELLQSEARISYQNKIITVHQFEGRDDTGPLIGFGSFNLTTNQGEFSFDSEANLTKVLRRFSIDSIADQLVSPLPPKISAKARLTRIPAVAESGNPDQWTASLYGNAEFDEFRLLGHSFNSLKSEFSWKNGTLFLRNLEAQHEKGDLKGTLMLNEDSVRYEAVSTLPLDLYKPFIKKGGIIERNISKTQLQEDSIVSLSLSGTLQRNKIDEWAASGDIFLSNISYNGVPLEQGKCQFNMTPLEARFQDIEATFAYHSYTPSQYAVNQPSVGTVTARSVNYDSTKKSVTIDSLIGQAWPAPVVNLFTKKVGTFIDKTIYLTERPSFTVGGIIDTTKTSRQTDLKIQLNQPTSLYYNFLGRDLHFENLTTEINLVQHSVFLNNLNTSALRGQIKGNIEVVNKNQKNPRGGYNGEFAFTNVSLVDIADRYAFETKTPGDLTGRIAFSGMPDQIVSLDGNGFIALSNANLFYVPIFGPLSPILRGLLGHRKTSHERVNNLSAGFNIRNGVVLTDDLYSTTPSAKITGRGQINLADKQMDITVQASTKGLLGVITLPLKPFEKLLQFRGTGHVSNPQWTNSPFDATKTPDQVKPPRQKAIIVE